MPLDDFFAKKEKKKSKKKTNPQELIEKLTKEVERLQEQDGEAASDVLKSGTALGDDEWEAIEEEEREIDIQSAHVGKLELGPIEDTTKQASKDKGDTEKAEEPEENKKVWAHKVAENKEEIVEPEPAPEPETDAPKKYIPIHLRQGANSGLKAPKPNVSSAADFPTLDAACTNEPSSKSKTPAAPSSEDDDNAGWSQAGVPQRSNRASDALPVSVSSGPAPYVPPALRSGGGGGIVLPTSGPRFENGPDTRASRSRDSYQGRFEGSSGGGHRFEGAPSREISSSAFDGWSRGATINTPRTLTAGPPRGSAFGAKVPSPSRPFRTNTDHSTDSNSGWTRNVNVKTFKETPRDNTEFQLPQTNRFAGLGDS